MPTPREQAILDYVEGSEFRRQLARRTAEEVLAQNSREILDGAPRMAERLVETVADSISELIQEQLDDSLAHLVSMGYPPPIPQSVSGWVQPIAEDKFHKIVDRAMGLVGDNLAELRRNLAEIGTTGLDLPATQEALLASVRATLRQSAAGLVAATERTAMDYAALDHAMQFKRPLHPMPDEDIDTMWDWYRTHKPGDSISTANLLTNPPKTPEGVSAVLSIHDPATDPGTPSIGFNEGRPGYQGFTAGYARDNRVVLRQELSKGAFENLLAHEVGHVVDPATGPAEYALPPPGTEVPLFAWETRMDSNVCEEQFENSCAPRHGWQLTIDEWDQIGRPQDQNLICSLYAKGAASNCRCMLIPGEAFGEMPEAIDVSDAVAAGRDRANEAYLSSGGTPYLSSTAGEAGEPLSKSPPLPPGAQPEGDQASTLAEPSDMSTSLTSLPSATSGPSLTETGLFEPSINASGQNVLQSINDPQELFRRAVEMKPQVDELLTRLHEEIPGVEFEGVDNVTWGGLQLDAAGSRIKGTVLDDGTVQPSTRFQEKLDGGKSPDTISDYFGARVKVDSADDVERIQHEFEQSGFQIIGNDDKTINTNDSGYRAWHFDVRKDGLSFEVQVLPHEVAQVKDYWELVYAKWRNVSEFTPAQTFERDAEYRAMATSYAEQWKAFQDRNAGIDVPYYDPIARADELISIMLGPIRRAA